MLCSLFSLDAKVLSPPPPLSSEISRYYKLSVPAHAKKLLSTSNFHHQSSQLDVVVKSCIATAGSYQILFLQTALFSNKHHQLKIVINWKYWKTAGGKLQLEIVIKESPSNHISFERWKSPHHRLLSFTINRCNWK